MEGSEGQPEEYESQPVGSDAQQEGFISKCYLMTQSTPARTAVPITNTSL